jgi:formylglycine-generating enzyme required for sulfatase activity
MIVFTSIASAQTPQQIDNSLGMKLVLIPSGQFTMGSNPGDLQSDA